MSDTEISVQESTSPAEIGATNGAKRGRGRPKKRQSPLKGKSQPKSVINKNGISDTNGTNGSEEEALTKKRGRKPNAEKPNKELKTVSTASACGAKRGRGRPKKSESKAGQKKRGRKAAKKNESEEDEPNDDDEEDQPEEEEEDED